jgi:hypothetical protein
MLRRIPWWVQLPLAALAGAILGVAAGYLRWGRAAAAMEERLATLESAATQVQGERERLHHELVDIVHERREMAATAEHLREQVEQQLRRLEALSAELAPPVREGEAPSGDAQ